MDSAGLTVAWTPSTLTAKVSGFTSIFGVSPLRTMCRFVIVRVPYTGMTLRLRPSLFAMPLS